MKPAMRLANSTTYWMAFVMWCAHCCHIHSADWGERHKNRHVITTWMWFSHGSQAGGSGPLCRAPCEPCSGTRGFPQVCTAPRWISSCLRRCTDTSPSETWRCSEWCGLKQQMCRARVSMWFSHIVLFTALGDFFRKQVDHNVIITLLPLHSYISRWCPSTEDKSPDGSAALDGSFLLLLRASIGIHWSSSVDGYSIITTHIHCAVYRPHSKPSCSLPSPVSTNYYSFPARFAQLISRLGPCTHFTLFGKALSCAPYWCFWDLNWFLD